MKCPNKNTVKYKALLTVYKTDLMTTNVIQSWQQATGSEAIPTVTEARNYAKEKRALHNLKQREFGEALLNNLRRERIIHSFQGSYYINNTEQGVDTIRPSDELVESNIKRLKRYLEINNLPESSIKLDKTPKTFAVTVDSSLFSAKDMIEKSRSWDMTRARHVVKHLVRLFPGVNVKLLSPTQAQKQYDNLPKWQKAKVPFANINSYFVDNQVVLVKGRVTDERAIEEVLHPFIEAVKVDNIPLFESLLKEAKVNFPEMTQQIEDAYNSKRRVNAEDREMEIVTQALARHFNKEYEESPTQSFKDVIGRLLEWFRNMIQNFNQYLTGRRIPVSNINPNASMSDIAKLLNTNGIRFEIGKKPNGRVRYSLSDGKQAIVNQANAVASTDQQRIVVKNLFQAVQESKNESDTLAGTNPSTFVNNLVVYNNSNNSFYDLNSNLRYLSTGDAIGNRDTFKDSLSIDYRKVLDAIALNQSYQDIQSDISISEEVFNNINDSIATLRQEGDVLVTNVVFSDPKSKIAGIADLVMIDKFGKIRISKLSIDKGDGNKIVKIPSESLLGNNNITSLSQDVLDMLEVNLLRRMVENQGYKVEMQEDNLEASTFKIEQDGINIIPRPISQNKYLVDLLIAENLYDLAGEQLDKEFEQGGLDGQLYDARTDDNDLGEITQIDPYENQPLSYLLGAIDEYKTRVISKKEMLNKAKNNIFIDRSKPGMVSQIDNTLSIINFALADPKNNQDVAVAYTQLLKDAFRQMKEYKEYIIDPNNFAKPEFADYLSNFEKYLKTFEGLYILKEPGYEELNATQRYLINNIEGIVNELLGPPSERENGRQGLINRALFDFVADVIVANVQSGFDEGQNTVLQSHSQMTFTVADMEALLTVVPDIGMGERFLRDASSSRDALLATLDKVYKRKWLDYLQRRENRQRRIVEPLEKLRKLQPNVKANRRYDFMLNFEEDGSLSEDAYVKKIGPQYEKMKQEIRLKQLDSNGVPFVYAPVYNLVEAQKSEQGRKDIEYNKKLADVKREFSDFMRAEKIVDGRPVDGDFHRYSEEFKAARAKHEVWSGKMWDKRRGQSDTEYNMYRAQYYEETRYTKAFRKNGVPTGQVKLDAKFSFVRPEFVETREQTADGMDMRSQKYIDIMEPKVNDVLAQARREVYDMFIEEYADGPNALLNLLPRDVRNQMLGKIPVVRDNLATNLKSDPAGGLFIRLWAKTQRSIKNLFTSTTEQKTVIIDEQGRMVDTLPIMFTGNPRVEERLNKLENEIKQLKLDYKNKKIGLAQYTKERALLESKVQKQRSQPTLGEVSTDLGSSLLMFSDMAEKFAALGEIEGTINALIKVIEKREYIEPGGNMFTGVLDGVIPEKFNLKGRQGLGKDQANVVARAHKWAKMVFYDNEEISKGFWDKFANGLITWSSQSYVAWNIFGNINNLAIAQINNAIEGVANRFITRGSYLRAEALYTKEALPGIVKRTGAVATEAADIILGSEEAPAGAIKGGVIGSVIGTAVAGPIGTALGGAIGGSTGAFMSGKELKERSYKPDQANNKYEGLGEYWRMMDADVDIRESGMDNTRGQQNRFQRGMSIGYLFQDGFEYAVQTKIGTGIIGDVEVIDSKTGESSNLIDAANFNPITGKIYYDKKWDTIIPEYKTGIKVPIENDALNDQGSKIYADIRNKIRDVNKEVHGNYARMDRTVVQSFWLGKLLFQFKKWLPPALRARYQGEYFNSTLGWMEGRYASTWKLAAYLKKNIVKGRLDLRNIISEYKDELKADMNSSPQGPMNEDGSPMGAASISQRIDNKIKNVNRTMAEASFIIMSLLLFSMLDKAWDDDEDDELWVKKLKNWSKYQTDRVYTELILFVPFFGMSEAEGFVERPIASTRTLGAIVEALTLSVQTPYNWISRETDNEFYQNKDVVYQNRPRKGQLKVYKQWKDALPILYTLQKWTTFEKMDNFYLGNN